MFSYYLLVISRQIYEKKNEINKCATHFVKLSEFDKVFFASLPMPHTLSNFQSLTKLIALIINHFYSYCRGDWQIALTKQNFSDTLFFASLPIVPSIQNSEFKIQNYSPLSLPKLHRRMSEGKSASWRSRVCDEGWAEPTR